MKFVKYNINDFSESDYNKCISLMEKERKDYINSCTNEKGKRLSVFGEWIAKKLIAEKCGCDIKDIHIYRDSKGKPFTHINNTFFSISHSGDFVCVAIDSVPIGVDIEVIRDINPAVIKKVCSDSDLIFLESGDETLNFFKIWTAKEAYFKMVGTGIRGLKEISYTDLSPVHYFEDGLIITIIKK